MTNHPNRKRLSPDAPDLYERLAEMEYEARERWMRRNGFTGMAAFALMTHVRAVTPQRNDR